MKILREVGITVLIGIAIFVPLRCTMQGYRVQYSCMLPNIEDGDWVLVNKARYFVSDPKRGEVIVFEPVEGLSSEYPFIKRIIALPGEVVEIRNGEVSIDGFPISEPYVLQEPPRSNSDFGPREMRAEEYFVLGDNRNNSNDSRSWGPVPGGDIIGKAWLVYWPLSKWACIEHSSYG